MATKNSKGTVLEELDYFSVVLEDDSDSSSDEKKPYIITDMLVADVVNNNKRRYALDEVQRALPAFVSAVTEGLGSAIVLADHPPGNAPASIKDAAGFIKNVYLDENTKTVKGKILILDTVQGKNILAIAKAGGRIGISSRALGELKEIHENGEVVYEVKNLKMKGFDFVVFPSFGEKATSDDIYYESIQEDLSKIFPTITESISELKEEISSIRSRVDLADLTTLKNELLESITKMSSCGCNSSDSGVFITTEKTETLINKEESTVMKTVSEFKENHPDLYTEIVTSVTEEVTKAVTASVTASVTESVTAEVKDALSKEQEGVTGEMQTKIAEALTAVENANKSLEEKDQEIVKIKEDTQPFIDILEGLVQFMREKEILVTEEEVLNVHESEGSSTPEGKTEIKPELLTEMENTIETQNKKLEELAKKMETLESEKVKLAEEKTLAEAEARKAEVSSAITTLLSESKYADILRPKLETATTVDEVKTLFDSEMAFIKTIETLNPAPSAIIPPTGEGQVKEEEVITEKTSETVINESMSNDEKSDALRKYQRRLAGLD